MKHELTENQKWNLAGREPYKFHPQASHVSPAYRDGWNDALDAVAKHGLPAGTDAAIAAGRIVAERAGENWDDIGEFAQQVIIETQQAAFAAAFPALVQQIASLRECLGNLRDRYVYRYCRTRKDQEVVTVPPEIVAANELVPPPLRQSFERFRFRDAEGTNNV